MRRLAGRFPAVLVTGARQTGKTSLLRRLFPEAGYVTLDYPAYAEAAATEPEALLDQFPGPVIIDEIQYVPSLLRTLKARIDANPTPGRFLLTGSQVFPLMQGVSESLAGRCGVYHLHTLSRREVAASGRDLDEGSFLFLGGYPEIHVRGEPELWFPSYVATCLERDVRNVLRVADLRDFHRFLRVCALRTGQVVNFTGMARDVGVAPNTARKWLAVLEAAGMVVLAEPYARNRTRRIIKSPRLFFDDTGLASFLCGFLSREALISSALVGPMWETHVHGEVLRWLAARLGSRPPMWWRTASGRKVDLVVELGDGRVAGIECRWAEDPGTRVPAGLRAFRESAGDRVAATFVVCRTRAAYRLEDGTLVTDLPGLLDRLAKLM